MFVVTHQLYLIYLIINWQASIGFRNIQIFSAFLLLSNNSLCSIQRFLVSVCLLSVVVKWVAVHSFFTLCFVAWQCVYSTLYFKHILPIATAYSSYFAVLHNLVCLVEICRCSQFRLELCKYQAFLRNKPCYWYACSCSVHLTIHVSLKLSQRLSQPTFGLMCGGMGERWNFNVCINSRAIPM